MATVDTEVPSDGALVEVRGQRWVVGRKSVAAASTFLELQSIEDGRYGETLSVFWEVEPGRRVLPAGSLPDVAAGRFDEATKLAAFLDAVRWSAVTSADVKTLQAPFRSGVVVEPYQLEPLVRAVESPKVNLLLSDDVGLGKTIEAGLVALELLLRNRARRVMVVCPAGLTVKWHDEMLEKFGLEFVTVDSEQLARLRRSHGSGANPFKVYPLTIVSLPWLRGPKAQRLLDEVLPPDAGEASPFFDLLILDEAHHVAPAGKQAYAVDSQQTKLIRRLAPHFEHRLFLSATPHNGYPESFTALLEIIDNQKFARGVEPDRAMQRGTVVRRLKRDIAGGERFKERVSRALPVQYPESERDIHRLLKDFAEVRRKRLTTRRGERAADLVTLLLKKRLFSSPSALLHTVGVYRETLQSGRKPALPAASNDVPPWLDTFYDDVATYDDEQLAEAEDDALIKAEHLQDTSTQDELAHLKRMEDWALQHEAKPDAKARELITYLKGVCKPDGRHWTNERVVVFTEYRDTQEWLRNLLEQDGLGGNRLMLMYGGLDPNHREQLRLAFQASPSEHPVRILLATDAASEGIDLHEHCHRLVSYDIPFNPNKLEQRIGRIDRYGQTQKPQVYHFIGDLRGERPDAYEADLEFLSRVATKVSRMEADLGKVNAVLSDAVQRRMLGEITDFDVEHAEAKTKRRGRARTGALASDTNVGEQLTRLSQDIEQTIEELRITPENLHRVVATALELDRERPLEPVTDDTRIDESELADGLFHVPLLTKSWVRATEGLLEKLERGNEPPRRRPITFAPAVAKGRHDVVYAHLGHPLVAMSTGLLRAAVWNPRAGLARVSAVVSDDPELEHTLAGVYSRFVLVGNDGIRLHEEVLYAGGWLPPTGRFRRLETLGTLGALLDRGLTAGRDASDLVRQRLVAAWPQAQRGLLAAVEARTAERRRSLENKLAARQDSERRQIESNFERFETSLRSALARYEEDESALFSSEELKRSERELAQLRSDRESWKRRLERLPNELDVQLSKVGERYRDPQPLSFPVAIMFVVPRREAVR